MRNSLLLLSLVVLLSACNGNSGSGSTTSPEDSLKALQPDTSASSRDTAYLAEVPEPEDPAATPPGDTKTDDPKSNERKSGTPEPGVYRFTVSFYSPGNGIDHAVKGKYDNFVADFGKRHKVKLQHETVSWGREGEVDYCFPLTELSTTDQAAFVKESLAILKASERVNTKENTTCRAPRK
jgi:hypothetical protein